jgi:hypothetical protein
MATTSQTVNAGKLPPYLPFATFRAAVQSLRTHGLPEKLDKTAWDSRSGGDQILIIGAFKFFGLMDDSERPEPILKKLTDVQENSQQERDILKGLLHAAYPNVFALNLKTATVGLVADAIGSMGVNGATRDRAVRFFTKAAQHSGVELSSRLTAKMRARSESDTAQSTEETNEVAPNVPRTRRRRRSTSETSDDPDGDDPPVSGKAVRTISLRNTAGELTLSGTFNAFELDGEERKLVYAIIDLMKAYEQSEVK